MAELLPIRVPSVLALHGNFQLIVDGSPAVLAQLDCLVSVIRQVWLSVGQRGGYPVAASGPGQSVLSAHLTTSECSPKSGVFLRARSVDPRSLQILRSASLAQISRVLFPMDGRAVTAMVEDENVAEELARVLDNASFVLRPNPSVSVDYITLPGADPCDEELSDYDLYPIPVLNGLFDLILDPQLGRLRRCIVEFERAVNDKMLDHLSMFIRPWVQLLELGGFEQPWDAPGRRSSAFGTIQIYDAKSVEIVIDRFEAAEGAWSILVNLLTTYCCHCEILRMEIH